jgi:hypothetical protein
MLLVMGMPKKGNKSALVGVDIATGEMKRQQDDLFSKPVQLIAKGAYESGRPSSCHLPPPPPRRSNLGRGSVRSWRTKV